MRFLSSLILVSICTTVWAQPDRSIVRAYKTDSQPTIDGMIDEGEWDAAGPWILVDAMAPNALLGDDDADADDYGGPEDASYRFKVMWQEETFNFFVLYEVFDDIAATEEPRDGRIWERDQVETFIDGTNLEGDDDPASYHWWESDETYGKLGVNRDNLFEGNAARMTDDQELWNDYNPIAPLISVSATGDTGEAANYYIELGVTLELMWDDLISFPFEGTPTDEAGHIVEDSTKIKFTNSVSDDDDFDHPDTDRSTTLTYYREIDGELGGWDQSNYYADLLFTGEFQGVSGDCNGDGVLTIDDLACQTTDTLAPTLGELNLISGDFDANGAVDFDDFVILSANFGQPGNYTQGDADGSGVVDFDDFVELSANFGMTSAAQVASVPEPSGWGLTWLAVVGLLWLRRRSER